MAIPRWLSSFGAKHKEKDTAHSVGVVTKRFLQVFADHGVAVPQIPRIVPELKLCDFRTPESLLASLSIEVLDRVSAIFGIRRQWLDGVGDEIYERRHCYKAPQVFLEDFASLNGLCGGRPNLSSLILTTERQLDYRSDRQQFLVPVLVEDVVALDDTFIQRFHVYQDGFDWGYAPTRIQLKALARVLFKRSGVVSPIYGVSVDEMQALLAGKVVPRDFVRGAWITSPSLEDYALTREESAVAKECEEIPAVLDYIKEYHLDEVRLDNPQQFDVPSSRVEGISASAAPPLHNAPQQEGKRARAQANIWGPVRNAALALWAQDNQLSIADVVRRIKMMPVFKASRFTESAIRKHVAELAPPGIRGKSGRKPNKPT